MTLDPMQAISAVNALFILASVWVLTGGERPVLGNWLMFCAAGTGIILGIMVGAWGLLIVNAVLIFRSGWILDRLRNDG